MIKRYALLLFFFPLYDRRLGCCCPLSLFLVLANVGCVEEDVGNVGLGEGCKHDAPSLTVHKIK